MKARRQWRMILSGRFLCFSLFIRRNRSRDAYKQVSKSVSKANDMICRPVDERILMSLSL